MAVFSINLGHSIEQQQVPADLRTKP